MRNRVVLPLLKVVSGGSLNKLGSVVGIDSALKCELPLLGKVVDIFCEVVVPLVGVVPKMSKVLAGNSLT